MNINILMKSNFQNDVRTGLGKAIFGLFLGILMTLVSNSLQAATSSAPDDGELASYGTVFIEEQRDRPVPGFRAAFGYDYEVSQPYLSIHSFRVSGVRPLGKFVGIGALVKVHLTSNTGVVSALEGPLKSQAVYQTVERPKYSVFGIVDILPLMRVVNAFGGNPLPFDLGVSLGAGRVFYHDAPFSLSGGGNRFAALWALRPGVELSPLVSIEGFVSQEIESPWNGQDRLARTQLGGNIVFSF